MLSVPTLYVVFLVNFLALGLIWTYVAKSYPKFVPARYWAGATFAAALGAALSTLRGSVDPLIPILAGDGVLMFAGYLSAFGVLIFYGRRVSWSFAAAGTALGVAGLALFALWRDDMAIRIVIYSVGQSIPLLFAMPLMVSRQGGRASPGARLAGIVGLLYIGVHAVRSVAAMLQFGGGMTLIDFNALQAAMVLLLVFLSMAWNFGFLMMSIDALRAEVAELALLDDLTGVANRRHLLQRLDEECARAQRTRKPFALLAIDLDGFKEINDGHGHAAGDECLRHFTLMVQMRLRPGDMLARTGGDEFCIVLPATTLMEGAVIAHRMLDACREDAAGCVAGEVPVAASIGVAEWSPVVGIVAERLMAAADHALYAAKNDGKNRYALYDPAPELAPTGLDPVSPAGVRNSA